MESVLPNPQDITYHFYQTEALVEELTDELTDCSTLALFEKPVMLLPCKHRMSTITVTNWLGTLINGNWTKHNTCPICQGVVASCEEDKLIQSLVDKVKKLNAQRVDQPVDPIQVPVHQIHPEPHPDHAPAVFQLRNPLPNVRHDEILTNVGTQAALLVGLDIDNACNKINIAHVRLTQEKGLSLNFKNPEDALNLFRGLEGKNYISTSYQTVNYISSQQGIFKGNVSISDPNEIARFVVYQCQLSEEAASQLVEKCMINQSEFGNAILRAAKYGFYSGIILNTLFSSPIKASEGANFAIASASAVMCEGGLSTNEAKNRSAIPLVRVQGDGLYITFPADNATYAKNYAGALSKAGYKISYSLPTEQQRLIKFTDPKDIAHFLKRKCHINSLIDIETYLHSMQLLGNSFCKAILEHYRDM